MRELLLLVLAMTLAPLAREQRRTEPYVHEPRTEAQRVMLESIEPELAISARKYVGKSWACGVKVFDYALAYPHAHTGLCREERASMENTTLSVFWGSVVPPEIKAACWNGSRSRLELPNGSRVDVFGLDEPRRIQGSRYGLVACDQAEDLDYTQFETLNSCVGQERMPWRQLMLAFNPADTNHWAFLRYKPDLGDGLRFNAKGRAFARVIHAQPGDLEDLIPADYRDRLDSMHGVFYQRLRLGLWCSAEGQVFDNWDPAVHVVEMPDEWEAWEGFPPPAWPRYFGIDFGYEPDPFACGWWAESPDGVRYLYRQLCHTRRTIVQQAEQVVALEAEELASLRRSCPRERAQELGAYLDELNITARFSDHHRGERAMLAEHGIHTQPADKDITASIQTVLGLLKSRPAQFADGRMLHPGGPSILIVRGSLIDPDPRLREIGHPCCLEEEMGGYVWRSTREGQLGGKARQLPKQEKDHCIDGVLRYVHHSLATRGLVGVLA